MKALADYVHCKGLKLGIYSSPGPQTCAGYEGSYRPRRAGREDLRRLGHRLSEIRLVQRAARSTSDDAEMQAVYQKMGDALQATGRPIVFSLCQYGLRRRVGLGTEGRRQLSGAPPATSRDNWESMSKIGFEPADGLAPYAGPGHWNDPDMLEIGNGGMTDTEYRTHMSLWAMLAAPLLAGNDLRNMSPDTMSDPDQQGSDRHRSGPPGQAGHRVWKSGDEEVWTRRWKTAISLSRSSTAALHRQRSAVNWSDIGLKQKPKHARDLWRHKSVRLHRKKYTVTVPSHGVQMLRVKG